MQINDQGARSAHSYEERLRLAEAASGIATFEMDLDSADWDWSPQAAVLFGLNPGQTLADWEKAIFFDDLPKVHAALAAARETGGFNVEFRVRRTGGGVSWMSCKGQMVSAGQAQGAKLRGACYDISERKALEARLLATHEVLDSRVAALREEARALELLNQTGIAVAAELDLERLVQLVTDAGVELSNAEFGAFFYNVTNERGEAYTLYTLSGAPRETFAKFPMPRNTAIFEPTFRGKGTVRSDDILADPRYGKSAPYYGMPKGHLPVRSYLAVSVISRSGEVLGGLFFGHSQPGVFTPRAEGIVTALAAQAAVAIDNAFLHNAAQREISARTQAERDLQRLNEKLEERAEERAKELSASQNELEDTERRFRLLVEGVTDYAIYMLDPSGNIVNWNPGAERFKGYKRHEVIGRHFSLFYTPEDQEAGIPRLALTAKCAQSTATFPGIGASDAFIAQGVALPRPSGDIGGSLVFEAAAREAHRGRSFALVLAVLDTRQRSHR